jgi:cell division protein FtsI (penicillin-binding protein 3)
MQTNRLKARPKRQFNPAEMLKIVLFIVGAVLVARLFYVQIIRHEHYQSLASAEHTKKFEIPAARGIISMLDGDKTTPVVLNEFKYTIYADPGYISDAATTADKLASLVNKDKESLKELLQTNGSRYVVLAKKLSKEQADKIDKLELKGVGKKEVPVRTYPQGNLASQLLGFVNDEGSGQYGIEEYENSQLAGEAGLEKAITDIRGIPLAINNDNVLKPSVSGDDIVLTVDIGMQRLMEDILKKGIERTRSIKGNAIIMEANTGAVKALASYPSYNPETYDQTKDISLFVNPIISGTWEPGSVIKPLLMAAAFTEKSITPDSTYFDQGYVYVDDRKITNAFNYGAQTMSIRDIINKSLNTGAVHVLKTLGGGDINQRARETWYKYLTSEYRFDKTTGIEQSGEVSGYISKPNEGDGLNVRYANMAFGQGMTLTPIQLVAAYAALLNGGKYYQPTLISEINSDGKVSKNQPKLVASGIISEQASSWVKEMTKNALETNYPFARISGYQLGGKSGTAQVPDGHGGYKTDLYDGTYIGYISGKNGLQYIMMIRLDEPKTGALASYEAAKVWAEACSQLINNYAIPANN